MHPTQSTPGTEKSVEKHFRCHLKKIYILPSKNGKRRGLEYSNQLDRELRRSILTFMRNDSKRNCFLIRQLWERQIKKMMEVLCRIIWITILGKSLSEKVVLARHIALLTESYFMACSLAAFWISLSLKMNANCNYASLHNFDKRV